jgi:hypothetical protein
VFIATVFSGCTWFSGGDVRLAKALTVTNNTVRYVVASQLPEGPLRELGEQLTTAVANGQSIKSTLDQIAVSDDPYGRAITTALCTGLDSLANRFDPNTQAEPTEQSWDAFMVAQVKVILPRNPVSLVENAVNRFTTAADLAQFQPQVAAKYLQYCLRR